MRALTRLEVGAFTLPEITKVKHGLRAHITPTHGHGGEDAYWVESPRFGVSDGVSEWIQRGVDSGAFARALVRSVVTSGVWEVPRDLPGSATLAVCQVFLEKRKASAVVLGDSQVWLVRGGGVRERTEEQEHAFGMPYQLDATGDGVGERKEYLWDVNEGDVIVVGTDGLFDNLEQELISAMVNNSDETCAKLAMNLVLAAYQQSQKSFGESPYSKAASEALNLAFSGGKKDDM